MERAQCHCPDQGAGCGTHGDSLLSLTDWWRREGCPWKWWPDRGFGDVPNIGYSERPISLRSTAPKLSDASGTLLPAPTPLLLLVISHGMLNALLPAAAALVSSPSAAHQLAGLPHSLAEHAAAVAHCRAILPELFDDDENCGQLNPSALATTSSLMREFSGFDARFATLAGGCFWGLELALQRTPGVLCTAVGYTQGHAEFPTYAEVCRETTGHTEAVLVLYDRGVVSYAALAELLFERIGDPTMLNRVGRDQGPQYRTGVYFHSEAQAAEARTAFEREAIGWRSSGREVVTEVLPAKIFWSAEEVHQRFLAKGNGRSGRPQSAAKGATELIRCYG